MDAAVLLDDDPLFLQIAERGAERDSADAEQTAKFLLGGKDGILRQIAGKDGVKDRIPGLAVLEFGAFEDHANLILETCIILVILFGIYHSPCGFQERETFFSEKVWIPGYFIGGICFFAVFRLCYREKKTR